MDIIRQITGLAADLEMASCYGNLTEFNNELRVHAHAVLTDLQARTWCGLDQGKVFAGELFLQE